MQVIKSEGATKFKFDVGHEAPVPSLKFSADFEMENAGADRVAFAATSYPDLALPHQLVDVAYCKTVKNLAFSAIGIREVVKYFASLKTEKVCASPLVTESVFPYPPNIYEIVCDHLMWTIPRRDIASCTTRIDQASTISITFEHVGSNITNIKCDIVAYPLACAIVGAVAALEYSTVLIAELMATQRMRPSEAVASVRATTGLYDTARQWDFAHELANASLESKSHECFINERVAVGKRYTKGTTKLNIQLVDWRLQAYELQGIPRNIVPQFQLQEFNARFRDNDYRYYPMPAVLALPVSETSEFFL